MKTNFQNPFGKTKSLTCLLSFIFFVFLSIGMIGCNEEGAIVQEPDKQEPTIQTKALDDMEGATLKMAVYRNWDGSWKPSPLFNLSISFGPRWAIYRVISEYEAMEDCESYMEYAQSRPSDYASIVL